MSRPIAGADFDAVFVPHGGNGGGGDDDTKHGTLQYWCPYCECVHVHGAANRGDEPRIEHRGAHCFHGVSPHAGRGIDLAVRPSSEASPLYPKALIDTAHHALTPRLRANLHAQGPAIRRAFHKALLLDTGAHRRKGKWGVWHGPDLRAFAIEGAGVTPAMANDLADLAARIFGVPWEVVARRFLETAIGRPLPAERALAVEAALRGDDA
ncbi:MAG TPA: hypothetical protein PLQ11_01625 [Beijerinckiaceae bacterium]|nr:hypothetical protein [Beijerinckiaceae bacterium]